jgi:heme/copper-type cytochrome/quinol oxidase subunit 3
MSQAAAPAAVPSTASTEAEKKVLGVTHGKMAMWIFLGSDGMSFMGLIAAYITLRAANHATWPSPAEYLGIWLTAANTLVLICSSVTMVKAFEGAIANDVKKLKFYLWWTIAGGSLFLLGQVYEYTHFFTNVHENSKGEIVRLFLSGLHEWNDGVWSIREGSTLFGSTFFVLTCFHGCHVFSGVVYLTCIQIGVYRGRWSTNRIEILGLYWHFVDLVWIMIFTIVYLVETAPPGSAS